VSWPDVAEYATGRLVDVYRGDGSGSVLLWHGRGPDERDALRTLASALAPAKRHVYVPDWNSTAADGGRADLLASLSWVRGRAGGDERFVLAGWSRGAAAAAAVVLNGVDGWRPGAFVGLAGGYRQPEPIHGIDVIECAARWPADVPCTLVHGVDDEVVPVDRSRELAAALLDVGIRVQLHELPTNHAGVVLARYDRVLRRAVATNDPAVLAVGERTVRALASR
jgi:predicted esterase